MRLALMRIYIPFVVVFISGAVFGLALRILIG